MTSSGLYLNFLPKLVYLLLVFETTSIGVEEDNSLEASKLGIIDANLPEWVNQFAHYTVANVVNHQVLKRLFFNQFCFI
jgi:hypothetical protein